MTSKIRYKCNFCDEKIISNSISDDFQGWCLPVFPNDEFTNNVSLRVEGPHICVECVARIVQDSNYTRTFKGEVK